MRIELTVHALTLIMTEIYLQSQDFGRWICCTIALSIYCGKRRICTGVALRISWKQEHTMWLTWL